MKNIKICGGNTNIMVIYESSKLLEEANIVLKDFLGRLF